MKNALKQDFNNRAFLAVPLFFHQKKPVFLWGWAHLSPQKQAHTTSLVCPYLFDFCSSAWKAGRVTARAEVKNRKNWGVSDCEGCLNAAQIVNAGLEGILRCLQGITHKIHCGRAHNMPRLWFMALPRGRSFLSPPLAAKQTSRRNYNSYCYRADLLYITRGHAWAQVQQ